jgi:hypothetical protein
MRFVVYKQQAIHGSAIKTTGMKACKIPDTGRQVDQIASQMNKILPVITFGQNYSPLLTKTLLVHSSCRSCRRHTGRGSKILYKTKRQHFLSSLSGNDSQQQRSTGDVIKTITTNLLLPHSGDHNAVVLLSLHF